VGILNDKEVTVARTSGAVLKTTVRIPRKDLRDNVTHIRATCGGIGGRDDIMKETGRQRSRSWQLKMPGRSSRDGLCDSPHSGRSDDISEMKPVITQRLKDNSHVKVQ